MESRSIKLGVGGKVVVIQEKNVHTDSREGFSVAW